MNNLKTENATLFENTSSIKSHVEKLLASFPHLRDDDNKLIANIWSYQIGMESVRQINGYDFLKIFADGNLTSPETIRRIRQKIQEQKPHLRGVNYKKRHELAESIRINVSNL